MAKTHYQGIPCDSKSWSDLMKGAKVYDLDGKGGWKESDVDIIPHSLPTTDCWGKVTCKKCLSKKPIDKNMGSIAPTGEQQIAISNLRKLIKSWPAGLVLRYNHEFGDFVVFDETRKDGWLGEMDAGNLVVRVVKPLTVQSGRRSGLKRK